MKRGRRSTGGMDRVILTELRGVQLESLVDANYATDCQALITAPADFQ